MKPTRHSRLALPARIDRPIAEAEALAVVGCDDDTLKRATATLAELR
jgi:hypothetical protein